MHRWIVLPGLLLSLVQCTSLKQSGSGGSKMSGQAVRIEMKGKPGTTSLTRYYSNSRVRTYADNQLLRDRTEAVDFDVRTTFQAYDPATQILKFKVRTVRKDGTVRLNELAFPEKNKEIDYVVRGNGTVLKAGDYPPQSLFFVPALPIPKEEVKVGDTWTMEHIWHSAADGIPLKLDIVGILKDVVPCDGGKPCADIEISGHVKLVAIPTVEGARFDSKVWGRVLYALDRGEIMWSEMRSAEDMITKGEQVKVVSCMISEVQVNNKSASKFECEPNEQPVTKTPTL